MTLQIPSRSTAPRLRCVSSSPLSCRHWIRRLQMSRFPTCSVSASADQINWVLTSYIVGAAIMTPASGFLANKVGRKRVLMVAVVGFVIASVLCGLAQSLVQIVAFRLLQGFFGAALVPLGQSVLLDIYTVEERGSAMAVFAVSVMVGPVLGPVIGGWLPDHDTALLRFVLPVTR